MADFFKRHPEFIIPGLEFTSGIFCVLLGDSETQKGGWALIGIGAITLILEILNKRLTKN